MNRPALKYKQTIVKNNRYEPFDYYEDKIIVPSDRHKLTWHQIKEARKRFAKNNTCMICYRLFKSEKDRCIDHCHVTGVIRGQICFSCNTALGHFKEDLNIMKSALRYMEHFKYNPDMIDLSSRLQSLDKSENVLLIVSTKNLALYQSYARHQDYVDTLQVTTDSTKISTMPTVIAERSVKQSIEKLPNDILVTHTSRGADRFYVYKNS